MSGLMDKSSYETRLCPRTAKDYTMLQRASSCIATVIRRSEERVRVLGGER